MTWLPLVEVAALTSVGGVVSSIVQVTVISMLSPSARYCDVEKLIGVMAQPDAALEPA